MYRIFVPKEQSPIISGSDVHYLRHVLRMKVGDEIELLDGTGKVYRSRITALEKEKVVCKIIASSQAESEPKVKVTLAQALPKASKMDFIIEKCTELGVYKIIPLLTERTVARGVKLARWRKLAKEAAEQSGRAIIPEIAALSDFKEILKMKDHFDLALIPWELEKEKSLKSILTISPSHHLQSILLLIGPEGGFSHSEVDQAKAAGFIPVSLGKRILRAETAGMAALAMVMYESDS
jgi:16S rRNA (uracil1498-N3)-methyltransferase